LGTKRRERAIKRGIYKVGRGFKYAGHEIAGFKSTGHHIRISSREKEDPKKPEKKSK
jgi:hypothetical protein